jgi:hypothetical protein
MKNRAHRMLQILTLRENTLTNQEFPHIKSYLCTSKWWGRFEVYESPSERTVMMVGMKEIIFAWQKGRP